MAVIDRNSLLSILRPKIEDRFVDAIDKPHKGTLTHPMSMNTSAERFLFGTRRIWFDSFM